ncbi:MAG: sugar transferase [Gemmataceae bacterium]|nr:sugar transferase [Gemmataceae bacterium]
MMQGELTRQQPSLIRFDRPHPRPGYPPRIQSAWTWYGKFKGGMDCLLALAILVLSSPVMLLAFLAVKLTSRGPVLYSQVRVGRGGRLFTIYKIRSMTVDCEKQSGARWSTPGDARITPVGRFLRKTHIDELPQLWNVLRGDMSLIGPRPERPEFIPSLEQSLPRYRERLLVRPGVSGLAQVQLPPDSTLESVRRKLAHDLLYVEKMSFWMDLRILISTGLRCLGVPYSLSAKVLALPGGESVQQAYERSLGLLPQGTGADSVVVTPATTVAGDRLVPNLQPA